MWPACTTIVALMVARATATGGTTALVVKKLRAKTGTKNINPRIQTNGGEQIG
jgi:hypothetical protein